MAKKILIRRGTTAQHSTFIGDLGEVTMDITKNTIVIHDGLTPGGHPMSNDAQTQEHINNTSNPHSVTKEQVGLGNVPNVDTTDPSNITQSANYRFVTDTEKSIWNGTQEVITTVLNGYVATTGDQDIDGVKNFTSSPIVPTPTTGTQAVNKDYVDNISTFNIGAILTGYTIFDNCIVAFGGEFNRADYPKLWAYLQANPSLVKTQAEWTTENTTNGMCGFFSYGNGTTTFRVPNLDKAFLRPDSRAVGSFQGDEFKSHTHSGSTNSAGAHTHTISNTTVSGGDRNLVYGSGSSRIGTATTSSSGAHSHTVTINSTGGIETRPKNIAVLPLIVAK